MDVKPQLVYEFGPFLLDVAESRLLCNGQPIHLTPKVFETLVVLLENRGSIVDKEHLITKIWPDTVVEESNLTVNISILRKILNGFGEEYIQTVPKRGYRFVASARVRPSHRQGDPLIDNAPVAVSEPLLSADPSGDIATQSGTLPAGNMGLGAGRRRISALAVSGLALLAIVAALYGLWTWQASRQVQAVRSIAVMPFRPIAADDGYRYLGLGIADALITRLGNIDRVIVRPTDAVRRFEGQGMDPMMAGRELAVEAVLTGTLQRSEDRIRVTVQLVRVSDGVSIWAGKFDENFTDIFSVQDQISEHIASGLVTRLTSEERELLLKRYTQDPEAYELYLKGRYYWSLRTPQWIGVAISCFNQAIEKDPEFALAYAGLADAYAVPSSGLPPQERFPKARTAASKALEIDSSLAEAHTALGYLTYRSEWDWSGAEKEFQRAIQLKPNYALAHHWYGEFLGLMGRTDESIAFLKRAQSLDPISTRVKTDLCESLYRARRYDEAIEMCQDALEIDDNRWRPHRLIGWALEEKQMYEQAIEYHAKAEMLLGMPLEKVKELKETYARQGMQGFLRQQLHLARQRSLKPRPLPFAMSYYMATIYSRLGDKEQAFRWLQKSCNDRNEGSVQLKVDPKLDNLRSDSRFQHLVLRVGLP